MKKIIFLSGAYQIEGGGEITLIDIIKNISDNYQIYCVCRKKGELSKILKDLKVKVFFCDLRWPRKGKYFVRNYIKFYKLLFQLLKNQVDLVYANSGHINPFAVRLAKKLAVPVITHQQSVFDIPSKDKYCFKKSTQLIANSKATANLLRLYADNIKVIYNAVNPDKFNPLLKKSQKNIKNKLNLDNYFLIGNASTIVYKKGFFEMVQVAKKVAPKIPEAKFLVIGRPKTEEMHILDELKAEITACGLESKFIFMGYIQAIENAIAGLDILLFPTHCEAFGRVIIEAMACKTPVISTYSGGPDEIITDKEDGFLFNYNDIEGMSNAIIKLYRDKELYQRMVNNAYNKFLDRFTINRMMKEIKLTIKDTIKKYENRN
jgi:glycosyltransferase involved in cell wall biosynthesis